MTTSSTTRTGTTIQRQPIVHPDRSIFAYALRGVVPDAAGNPLPEASTEHLVDAMFGMVDLERVAGERPLVVRGTRRMLETAKDALALPQGGALELPGALQRSPQITSRLTELADAGVRVALGDFVGAPEQVALLPYVHMVKVDAGTSPLRMADLVREASARGAVVVAENASSRVRVSSALEAGVELLQGPLLLERAEEQEERTFTVGEIQCLELIRLVSAVSPDPDECARTVESDPELSIRVLHLVNSSAMGVRHKVDSVHRAVVLVGPRQLGAIATAALVGSSPASMETLWYLLTRATACGLLTGDDTGYTVGMLSAVAAHLKVATSQVVSRTGVSHEVADALQHHRGPYGQALAAVLAQENNDTEGVAATGHHPYDVSRAYLDAVSTALSLAGRLASA